MARELMSPKPYGLPGQGLVQWGQQLRAQLMGGIYLTSFVLPLACLHTSTYEPWLSCMFCCEGGVGAGGIRV